MPRSNQTSDKSAKTLTRKDGATSDVEKKARKPYRHKPGVVARQMIRRLQKVTDPILKKAPFKRIVRAALRDVNDEYKMKAEAYVALQNIVEELLYRVNYRANYLVRMGKRKRLRGVDVDLAAHTSIPQFFDQPLEGSFVLPRLPDRRRVKPNKNARALKQAIAKDASQNKAEKTLEKPEQGGKDSKGKKTLEKDSEPVEPKKKQKKAAKIDTESEEEAKSHKERRRQRSRENKIPM